MPTALINLPFSKVSAGTLGQVLTGYDVLLCTAAAATGIYVGPITLPAWVDVSRPIRIFFWRQQAAYVSGPNGIVWNLRVVGSIDGASDFQQEDQMTDVPPAGGPSSLYKTELVNDTNPSDPVYPGGLFTPGQSLGFHFRRLGLDASDGYPNTVSLATYLELQASVRCQLCGCP